MGFAHRYNLIKEGEKIKDELRHPSSLVVVSWWTFLLCNLVAACAGAAAMILIADGFQMRSPSSSSSSAVANTASFTFSSVSLTSHTPTPTPSAELVKGKVEAPNALAGKILDCGGNPTEARAKGCVFDVMMQDWVPVPCYDAALTEKYLAEGNWTWYADGDGKTTLSDEEMAKGEHGAAWMSTSYHKAHCVFSWLKIIRALRNKQGISQELLSYDHVLHCSHGALREDSNDESLGVQAPTNYAKCALYETWEQDFIPDKHDSSER